LQGKRLRNDLQPDALSGNRFAIFFELTSCKIVIAPDKFKGSLTATAAAKAIERGVLRAAPDARCVSCPMADGGEGTVDAFLEHGASRRSARVRGPLGTPVDVELRTQGLAGRYCEAISPMRKVLTFALLVMEP
jgi:Glycerate kinase family